MDTSASGARTGGPGIAIPGRPRYRLTPQAPYQQTPEAWLDAFEGATGTIVVDVGPTGPRSPSRPRAPAPPRSPSRTTAPTASW
jgi:hypothetical protein